jgi:Carboxypeptidase regulatory-like domain
MQIRYYLAASAAALSIATLVGTPAMAQQITTGIEGSIADENGEPIVGATVEITDTRTGSTRTVTTGSGGSFVATSLVTGGPYTVSVNADGFEGQTLENINTSLQGNTSLDFTLTSGSGDIVVTGSRVRVTQLAVGPGISFSAEILDNTPSFNRDIRDVIRLDPRVSLDRDDAGSGQDRISCLGGNDRGNAFTVDGISQGDIFGLNNTGFSSRSSTPLPYAAVRETQVQFAPFDVDYGQFTGCAINVVTKSGTNEYTFGGFFEYADDSIRGDSVAGRPVAAVEPEKRWGAYLGGPVIKDRLFLFGSYEHQEAGQSQDEGPSGAGYPTEMPGVSKAQFDAIREVINRVYKIDTGDLVFSRPFKNDRYFVRADLQITDDHRFEATYQRLKESTMRADDLATTGTFANTAVGQNTFLLSGTDSTYYSGRLYSQWSDKFSTELRYSRSDVQDIQDPVGGGEAQSGNPIPRIVVGVDNATGADGVVQAGPGFSRAANDLKTKLDQYRAVAKLDAGDHQIKFGAELNRANLFNLFVQNATGTLTFRNISDLEQGLLSPGTGNNNVTSNAANTVGGQVEGAFGNFSATGDIRDAAAAFQRDIWSVFAQDDWQITDSLSAVMGVRADWYDGGRPKLNPNFVTRYGFGNDTSFSNIAPVIMPRLALSYDAGDFGVFSRAQVRGGVGVFSGGDPVVWFANAFQNDGRGFALGTTQDASCPTGQIDVVVNGQFTGVPSCFRNAASATAAAGRGRTQSIDPNIKMPTVLRANVGFSSELNFTETGFFSGWNLNLDYIYSKYRNPFNIIDLSQIPDFRTGLSGFSIDGRPIYAAIDPSITGCTARLTGYDPRPTYSNVNNVCFTANRDDELMLTNAGSYRSHIASFILSKQFEGGLLTDGGSVFFSLGYAYTDAQDRRNMYSSTAGSNYDDVSAFDRQNPAPSRGFFASKHNLTVQTNFKEQFFGEYDTRLGITFIARSGRPYSLTFGGFGTFNDNASGSDNTLVYLPTGITDPNISPTSSATAVQQLVDFANGLDCAKKYIGKSIPRNTCTGDTYYDMDLSFSQELPGPGHLFGKKDKIRLYATMDNFLNFLDSGWNVQRRRDFAGRQDIATSSGLDSAGRYIITSASQIVPSTTTGLSTFDTDNQINFSSSVWRMKIGISYDF